MIILKILLAFTEFSPFQMVLIISEKLKKSAGAPGLKKSLHNEAMMRVPFQPQHLGGHNARRLFIPWSSL